MNVRNWAEYIEGRNAFYDGLSIDDNPYKGRDNRRICWFTGWLDCRTYQNTGIDLRKVEGDDFAGLE